jgi:hypothetical protein
MIPPRIFSQRTVCISCLFTGFLSSGAYIHVYYLPIYFQSARVMTAAQSGVNILSYVVALTLFIVTSGYIMTRFMFYVPMMWVGSATFVAGAALLYTIGPKAGVGKYTGYQIITGAGFGLAFQVAFVAVQVVTSPKDLPVAVALVIFFRSLGGAIGLDLAQVIFSRALVHELNAIPTIDLSAAVALEAGDISQKLNPEVLGMVRDCYSRAISTVFILPIVVGGLAFVSSGLMERRRIPAKVKG